MTAKFSYKLIATILIAGFINSAQAAFEGCKDFFPNGIVPKAQEIGRDLCFDGFAVYYSANHKRPIYTVEKLDKVLLSKEHPKRTNQFYEEARLPSKERARLDDYKNSGYDRGHNAPAGDMTSENAMAQSFSLANMMPQAPENNRGVWAKNVEAATRKYALRAEGPIYVYTGSIGDAGSIGFSKVVIPTHLFKLVYDPAHARAWGFWVENLNSVKPTKPISYKEIVEKTGINFQLPIN